MIFADKLIQLRKKSGWSQEELAEQMNVSRQSVSKWEGAQSVPDLAKIVRLSELFGVSTDYLLKEEMEMPEPGDVAVNGSVSEKDSGEYLRRVSMEEANAFLEAKEWTAPRIALGGFLCILSPVTLMILSAVSELPDAPVSKNAASGMGLIVLVVLVALGVVCFISSGHKTGDYEYLEKEVFETEYGVTGMVKARKEEYRTTYSRNILVGSVLCILSVLPFFAVLMISEDNELLTVGGLSLMFLIVGIGASFLIRSGIIWESYEKLLQEGSYTRQKKTKKMTELSTIYWLLVAVIYFVWSFLGKSWSISWIVWVIAGILYVMFQELSEILSKDRKR